MMVAELRGDLAASMSDTDWDNLSAFIRQIRMNRQCPIANNGLTLGFCIGIVAMKLYTDGKFANVTSGEIVKWLNRHSDTVALSDIYEAFYGAPMPESP